MTSQKISELTMSKINLAMAQVYSKEQSYEELLDSIYTSGMTVDDVFFPVEGSCPEEILQTVLTLTLDALVGAGYGDRKEIIKNFIKHYFKWDESGYEYNSVPIPKELNFIDFNDKNDPS